jgi:hypothetical protein
MIRPPFEKPKRFYRHKLKFFWTYWTRHTQYVHDDQPWHSWEERAVFIGLRQRSMPWFGYEDLDYDGHTCQYVSFGGIVVGKLYSHDSEQIFKEAA